MIPWTGRPDTGQNLKRPGAVRPYKPGPRQGATGPPGLYDLQNPSLHNSQIHQQTNVTSSLPIIVRPWMDKYQDKFLVGSVLFARENSSNNRMTDVVDIPTLNHFATLRKSALPLNIGFDKMPKALVEPDGIDIPTLYTKDTDPGSKYNFFGVVRNDMMSDTTLLTKLYNCDVWGRSMIANIFGRVKRGDRVGLVYAKVRDITQYSPDGLKIPNIAYQDRGGGQSTEFYQVFGVVNGEERVLKSIDDTQKLYIPLGVVSHGVSKLPSDGQIKRALRIQDDYILLPHIEILLM